MRFEIADCRFTIENPPGNNSQIGNRKLPIGNDVTKILLTFAGVPVDPGLVWISRFRR